MLNDNERPGGPGPVLVFCCSGAADVGEIAHLAARRMDEQAVGSRFCLAGIGGRVEAMLRKVREARRLVVIDGCQVSCGRRTMKEAGFTDIAHVCVGDLGLLKGQAPPTEERVALVAMHARSMLGPDVESTS